MVPWNVPPSLLPSLPSVLPALFALSGHCPSRPFPLSIPPLAAPGLSQDFLGSGISPRPPQAPAGLEKFPSPCPGQEVEPRRAERVRNSVFPNIPEPQMGQNSGWKRRREVLIHFSLNHHIFQVDLWEQQCFWWKRGRVGTRQTRVLGQTEIEVFRVSSIPSDSAKNLRSEKLAPLLKFFFSVCRVNK